MKVVIMVSCLVVALAMSDELMTLCGRHLANARMILCDEIYKRTYQSKFDTLEEGNGLPKEPWKARKEVLGTGWNKYKWIGLADECCRKPCSINEILKYC